MLTTTQRRKRANMLKAGVAVALAVIVFTPKLNDIPFPEIGFPLVTTAVAAPPDEPAPGLSH